MGAMFNKVADLGMTYVPYKGGAPSLADLMTGRLQMQFDALTLLQPLVKDGKLRALAVTTPTRWPGLPDVPTLREAGFADFPGNPWAGIMAPPNTPPPIVSKLNATINDILHSPEAKASLAKLNVLLRPGSPQEFSAFVAEQTPKWTRDGEGVRRQRPVNDGPAAAQRRPARRKSAAVAVPELALPAAPCAPDKCLKAGASIEPPCTAVLTEISLLSQKLSRHAWTGPQRLCKAIQREFFALPLGTVNRLK